MHSFWLEIVDALLRPSRPELARCLALREVFLAERAELAGHRSRQLADCEARIERARDAVFVADDGVVSSLMTTLEREWRRLARRDPDAGLMDLWARVAPPSWLDRKRWRDSGAASRVDAAVALASDVAGVERAEAAVDDLRATLAPWGAAIGRRLRWRFYEGDAGYVERLLAEPVAAATAATPRDVESIVVSRATALAHHVRSAVLARLPDHPKLADDVAHAAYVRHIWEATPLRSRPDPVAPLAALWRAGYVLGSVREDAVTIELPNL